MFGPDKMLSFKWWLIIFISPASTDSSRLRQIHPAFDRFILPSTELYSVDCYSQAVKGAIKVLLSRTEYIIECFQGYE